MGLNGLYPVASAVQNPALGSDLGGVYDLTPSMLEVSGRTALVQNLARRLITTRGSLIYDQNYGFDLTQYVNSNLSSQDAAALVPQITAEMLKDQRVLSCSVSLQWVGITQVQAALIGVVSDPMPIPNGALVISVQITDGTGPFSLTLSVTSVTAQIVSVT